MYELNVVLKWLVARKQSYKFVGKHPEYCKGWRDAMQNASDMVEATISLSDRGEK